MAVVIPILNERGLICKIPSYFSNAGDTLISEGKTSATKTAGGHCYEIDLIVADTDLLNSLD